MERERVGALKIEEHSLSDLARRTEGGGGFKGYHLCPRTPMRTRVGGVCIVYWKCEYCEYYGYIDE